MSPIEVDWDGDPNHRDCGEFPLPTAPAATDEPHWLEIAASFTCAAVSLWALYGCAWRLLLAFDRLIGY